MYREGETATIFADVPSEPAAEDIRWFIGGSELVHDPKNGVVIDNTKEHKSKLQIDAVSRKQEGKVIIIVSFESIEMFSFLGYIFLFLFKKCN